jgi:hypothetical protein
MMIGAENIIQSFGSSENPEPPSYHIGDWAYSMCAVRLWRVHPKSACARSEFCTLKISMATDSGNRTSGHHDS